jgi:SAM-dependent methyltransferase
MSKHRADMMELYKEDDSVVHFGQLSNPYDNFLSYDIVLPYLKHGTGNVLDLGCGAGRNAVEAAKMGYDVVAIELYEQPLRIARKYVEQQGVKDKVTLYQKDFFKLRKGELGRFNYCILQEVLEHVDNYRGVIDIAFNSLKKDGVLIITTRYNPKLWNSMDEYANHVRRFTKSEIIEATKQFSYVKYFITGFPFYRFANSLYMRYLKIRNIQHNTSEFQKTPFLRNIYVKAFPILLRIDRLFDFTNLGNTIVVIATK